jgi:hypothetical protein
MEHNKRRLKTLNVTSAEEAIVALIRLRRQSFFSFRGQRNCEWSLGPHHNIPNTWEDIKEADLREKGEGKDKEEMIRLEQEALADKRTDHAAYWRSKSVRKHIRRHLHQFIRHSQVLRDTHHCADHLVSFESPLRAKSERWWNELMFAHHHGLKSLLLDWTSNPLVALYFAVENAITRPQSGVRGAVFAIRVRGTPYEPDIKKKRWHNFNEVVQKYPFGEFCPFWIMINPPLNSDRIVRQSGKFSYHPSVTDRLLVNSEGMTPERGLYDDEMLIKVEIGKATKDGVVDPSDDIRKIHRMMNIHRASLFPDHDGIATYLNDEWADIARDAPMGASELSDEECRSISRIQTSIRECLGRCAPKNPGRRR